MQHVAPDRLWVLVTDGHRARIAVPEDATGAFRTLLTLGVCEYPHCPPPLPGSHECAAHGQFTADIARRLDDAAERGAFDRLIVVAPRAITDELRDVLGAAARMRLGPALDSEDLPPEDAALAPRLARWWHAPELS
jgi:hypothetical protein